MATVTFSNEGWPEKFGPYVDSKTELSELFKGVTNVEGSTVTRILWDSKAHNWYKTVGMESAVSDWLAERDMNAVEYQGRKVVRWYVRAAANGIHTEFISELEDGSLWNFYFDGPYLVGDAA